MKDESHNPTGSFKARGISVAISKQKNWVLKNSSFPLQAMQAVR
jgi:threonine synthase